LNDEALPNFIKRKHPRKGEKKEQEIRTQFRLNGSLYRKAAFFVHI
jgi:hypothetical protein